MKVVLKFYRLRNGWSIEQLSQKSGVALQTIVRIEAHGHIPRGSTLKRLADALGITTQELLRDNKGAEDMMLQKAS